MNIKKFLLSFFSLLILTFIFSSCGDSSTGNNNTTSSNPNIVYKPGAIYYYTNDTITQNGTVSGTTWLTTDVIQAYDTNYQGKSCYPVNSTTKDTVTHLTIRSKTDYYSYNQTDGKFYQYGARKLFDSTQAATWDLVADFTQPIGTEISLYTINNLFGNPLLSANVKSKVAVDTVIQTTAQSSVTINCFRVGLKADVYATSLLLGTVYIDYYIGYTPSTNTSNPSGRVRTKIYPISFTGQLNLKYPGVDQIMNRFSLP